MKSTKRVIAIVLFGCLLQVTCNEVDKKQMKTEKKLVEKMEEKEQDLLRHMVIFKFNDDAPAEEVEAINASFNDLKNHIPVIKDFEWGLNDSPENFHQDFTHCYMLTFHSEKDRDSIYTPHPKHQEFVASLQPHLEKVFVVDYWAK